MKRNFLSFILIIMAFTGCSQPEPVKLQNPKPFWITNPSQNAKIGAVGVAGRTYDQKISTQRKKAITRALEELSLQQGVKVHMRIEKQEMIHNDRQNTSMDVDSTFQTENTVTAHEAGAWEDEATKELYIWMTLD